MTGLLKPDSNHVKHTPDPNERFAADVIHKITTQYTAHGISRADTRVPSALPKGRDEIPAWLRRERNSILLLERELRTYVSTPRSAPRWGEGEGGIRLPRLEGRKSSQTPTSWNQWSYTMPKGRSAIALSKSSICFLVESRNNQVTSPFPLVSSACSSLNLPRFEQSSS